VAGENRCFIKDKIGSCCRTDVNFYVGTHSHVIAISTGLQHNPSWPEARESVFPVRVSPDFVASELASHRGDNIADVGTRNRIAGAVCYRSLYSPLVAGVDGVALGAARRHAVHSLLDRCRIANPRRGAFQGRRGRIHSVVRGRSSTCASVEN